jgi:DNA-binding transcriptional MerR regulator
MTSNSPAPLMMATPLVAKDQAAFRTITEVAADLQLETHVLRFWESKFPKIKPVKLRGGRRYYRPQDIALLQEIKDLLYTKGFTIKGAQKVLGKKRGIAIIGAQAEQKIIDQTIDRVFENANENTEQPAITADLLQQQIADAVAKATAGLQRDFAAQTAALQEKFSRTELHLLASQEAYSQLKQIIGDVVGDLSAARDALSALKSKA